jgi:transcriptional regulator with XRE-family HTH domain
MAKKSYAYVRTHRRKWGLTQVELAGLLGLTSRTAVSRIERADRIPTTANIIACGIIFGLATPELFPSLQEEIERAVVSTATALLQELFGKTDQISVRKRAFVEQILERISNRK